MPHEPTEPFHVALWGAQRTRSDRECVAVRVAYRGFPLDVVVRVPVHLAPGWGDGWSDSFARHPDLFTRAATDPTFPWITEEAAAALDPATSPARIAEVVFGDDEHAAALAVLRPEFPTDRFGEVIDRCVDTPDDPTLVSVAVRCDDPAILVRLASVPSGPVRAAVAWNPASTTDALVAAITDRQERQTVLILGARRDVDPLVHERLAGCSLPNEWVEPLLENPTLGAVALRRALIRNELSGRLDPVRVVCALRARPDLDTDTVAWVGDRLRREQITPSGVNDAVMSYLEHPRVGVDDIHSLWGALSDDQRARIVARPDLSDADRAVLRLAALPVQNVGTRSTSGQ